MAEAPIEMWEMQVAFAIGLLGIYVGWRGTIAKMTGFYDLSGAVKTLLFGIISGVLAASAIDVLILAEVRNETQNIISISAIALMIALAESSFTLFVLGRSRTVGLRACAPYELRKAIHLRVRDALLGCVQQLADVRGAVGGEDVLRQPLKLVAKVRAQP